MSTIPESNVSFELTDRTAPKQYTITISGVTDASGNSLAARFAPAVDGAWSLNSVSAHVKRQIRTCRENFAIDDQYTCEPAGDGEDTASITREYLLFPRRGGYILRGSGMGEGPAKVMLDIAPSLADAVYLLRIKDVKPDTDDTKLDVEIDVTTNPANPVFTLKGPSSLIGYDDRVHPSSDAAKLSASWGIHTAVCAMQTMLDWGYDPQKGNFSWSKAALKEVTRRSKLMLSQYRSGDWEQQVERITTEYPNWNFDYQMPSGARVSTGHRVSNLG